MFQYLFWHYTDGFKSFIRIWKNYIRFFWHFFSVRSLFETLFYHWHRDITFRGPGFDFKEFFRTLAFNTLSRVMGAIVRLATIITGLLFEALVIISGFFLFFAWLFFPSIIIGLLIGGGIMAASSYFGLVMIILAAGLIYFAFIFYSLWKKKLPLEMTFEEMMKQAWFDLVWVRAGIDPRVGRQIPFKNALRILESHDLSNADFNEIVKWVAQGVNETERKKRFWSEENLFRVKGIGKNWAYGYTNQLDKFSVELSQPERITFDEHLVGREKELEMLERILAKANENNVLVIGEPGTGRETIIRKFAKMVYEGKVLAPLQHKRVLELDVAAVMSGSSGSSEMEDKLRLVLNEAVEAGNIILVIKDFQNFVGEQGGLGKTSISGILVPYLNSRHIQVIALTTYQGLHRNIEQDIGLMKFFEKVEIEEPKKKDDLLILQDIVFYLEPRIGVWVTYGALKEVVEKSIQYPTDVPMPGRAIDLLEESMIFAKTKTSDFFLLKEHVDLVISEKTGIPIGEVHQEEKEKLADLEGILHHRVIGQDEAVREIASAIRRIRAGVGEKNKPMGSFLFLGPTGVGKTETAKSLAEIFFSRNSGKENSEGDFSLGREKGIVRLDMSEYQNISDISRLIGSPDGDPGFLTTQIRENPFAVVLFDEIEKAHKDILNIFLQVLDEGFLTDGWGRKVNFRNNIIIATSNAGAELIREMVGQNIDPNAEKGKIMDYLQKNNIFRPEFLNRFDGIVVFHPLTKRELMKVAKLMLDSLNNRLAEQKITLGITTELLEKVVELGFNPEYGARPMRRVIQDKIEDLISRKILDGSTPKGSVIEIRPEEI